MFVFECVNTTTPNLVLCVNIQLDINMNSTKLVKYNLKCTQTSSWSACIQTNQKKILKSSKECTNKSYLYRKCTVLTY